ncbi:GOLPH3/VPS74 family protein [Nocardioides pacificus]
MSLIAEDLLLLLLDDETGRLTQTHDPEPLLGGAVLIELALAGTLEVHRGEGRWSRSTVRLVPGAPAPQDQVLVDGLAIVARKERAAQDLVAPLGKGLRQVLLARLETQGILERREDKVLGLFPRHRWPARATEHEDGVRHAIADALRSGVAADPHIGALIALLSAVDRIHKVIVLDDLSDKEVRHRAKVIADDDWAAEAVKDAVAAAQAAMVAVMVATTVATGAAGN